MASQLWCHLYSIQFSSEIDFVDFQTTDRLKPWTRLTSINSCSIANLFMSPHYFTENSAQYYTISKENSDINQLLLARFYMQFAATTAEHRMLQSKLKLVDNRKMFQKHLSNGEIEQTKTDKIKWTDGL